MDEPFQRVEELQNNTSTLLRYFERKFLIGEVGATSKVLVQQREDH